MNIVMKTKLLFITLTIVLLLSACTGGLSTPTPTALPLQTATPEPPTATPEPPTPTPLPLAVRINDGGILLSEYEAEVQRQQAADTALGRQSTPEEIRQRVLDDLVGQYLLAEAAYKAGFSLSDADLQVRIDALANQLGSPDALAKWQSDNFYNPESFTLALRRQVAALWQRNQIVAGVSTTAEQVHARQILVRTRETADKIIKELGAGSDFATLAKKYDPLTGGDLGWFSRGMLTQSVVEEAAFALQPDQVSQIIESPLGFHIVQVIERDPNRPLTAEALQNAQQAAVRQWVETQKSTARIEILIP